MSDRDYYKARAETERRAAINAADAAAARAHYALAREYAWRAVTEPRTEETGTAEPAPSPEGERADPISRRSLPA